MARPVGVTILGVFALLGGVVSLALGGLFVFGTGYLGHLIGMPTYIADIAPRAAATFISIGIFDLVIAYGLFGVANWARILTMICAAVSFLGMALDISQQLMRAETYLIPRDAVVAAIDIVILLYLLRPRIKQAFSRRPAAAQPPPAGTPETTP